MFNQSFLRRFQGKCCRFTATIVKCLIQPVPKGLNHNSQQQPQKLAAKKKHAGGEISCTQFYFAAGKKFSRKIPDTSQKLKMPKKEHITQILSANKNTPDGSEYFFRISALLPYFKAREISTPFRSWVSNSPNYYYIETLPHTFAFFNTRQSWWPPFAYIFRLSTEDIIFKHFSRILPKAGRLFNCCRNQHYLEPALFPGYRVYLLSNKVEGPLPPLDQITLQILAISTSSHPLLCVYLWYKVNNTKY